MALAAGLQQTLEENGYRKIIYTRAQVSTGDEIGFLPGSEKEKMDPWMGAFYDNLEVLIPAEAQEKNGHRTPRKAGRQHFAEVEHRFSKEEAQDLTNQEIMKNIEIKNIGFMRGRSFFERFIIIDEAQNLTPKQMKMLISRAGEGTKIVCLGNNAQIDTPYLTEASSGLTVLVDRFKGLERSGYVLLQAGERSWLANTANEVL